MKLKLSSLPSVDRLVNDPALKSFSHLDHSVRVRFARKVIQEARDGKKGGPLVDQMSKELDKLMKRGIRRVINATGIVLHTNLGRAPLGKCLEEAARELSGYSTLEFDLQTGERGSRTETLEQLFTWATGAEAALVVNNNAAAVFLTLHALSSGKPCVISRGELVQIGGGFRIPEILEASGATLSEVGTTNITRLKDYEKGASGAGMILKVHPSNFTIKGHTESVALAEVGKIAKKLKIPFVVDAGSGALDRTFKEDLVVDERLLDIADVVCFSGDKLLGGIQAGIILGKKKTLSKIKQSPLYRALRLGKVEIYLLEKLIKNYITGEMSETERLLSLSAEVITQRANRLAEQLKSPRVKVSPGDSSAGGGSLPGISFPTSLIEISTNSPAGFAKKLLSFSPPIVARKDKGRVSVDLRTVFEEEEPMVVQALNEALACLS